jgi:hypothetical protein
LNEVQIAKEGKFIQVGRYNHFGLCGVSTAGSIQCGNRIVRSSNGDFVQISVSNTHVCGLTETTMECFKTSDITKSDLPKKVIEGHFDHVSVGSHVCAVSEAQLVCFDMNAPKPSKLDLSEINKVQKFSKVTVGNDFICGLVTDGTIHCYCAKEKCPAFECRRLVKKKKKMDFNFLDRMFLMEGQHGSFVQASTSSHTVCGVTTGGTIECKGCSNLGRDKVHFAKEGQFVQVSADEWRDCGLTTKGQIECRGSDHLGASNGFLPALPSDERVSDIVTGGRKTLYLFNGVIHCAGDKQHRSCPKHRMASQGSFLNISSYEHTSCGLTSEGSMDCFGLLWDDDRTNEKAMKATVGKFTQTIRDYRQICHPPGLCTQTAGTMGKSWRE